MHPLTCRPSRPAQSVLYLGIELDRNPLSESPLDYLRVQWFSSKRPGLSPKATCVLHSWSWDLFFPTIPFVAGQFWLPRHSAYGSVSARMNVETFVLWDGHDFS